MFVKISSSKEIKNNNTFNMYKAKIVMNINDGKLKVIGEFINSSSEKLEINYKLILEKKGASGKSFITQSGSYAIGKGKEIELSKTEVDINDKDLLTISLDVFQNENVIASDSLVFNGTQIIKK